MGGGGGRGVLDFDFCGRFGAWVGFFGCTGAVGRVQGDLCVAIVSTDGSEIVWEPGSAMVPTFCADGPKPCNCSPVDAAPGSAKAGDGDLPLAEGDGGGDPKRESPSSACSISIQCKNMEYKKLNPPAICNYSQSQYNLILIKHSIFLALFGKYIHLELGYQICLW